MVQITKKYLSQKDKEDIKIIEEKKLEEDLKNLEGMDNKMLAILAINNNLAPATLNLNDPIDSGNIILVSINDMFCFAKNLLNISILYS